MSNKSRTLTCHKEKSCMSFLIIFSFLFCIIIDLTTTYDEQDWKKQTFIPITNNHQVHISSSVIRTRKENQQISMNTQPMKSYSSLNTIINKQSTPTAIQTTSNRQTTMPSSVVMNNQEYTQTLRKNRKGSVNTVSKTFFVNKSTTFPDSLICHFSFCVSFLVHDYGTTASGKRPLITYIDIQSSTSLNRKKIILENQKETSDDHVIDNRLLS